MKNLIHQQKIYFFRISAFYIYVKLLEKLLIQ